MMSTAPLSASVSAAAIARPTVWAFAATASVLPNSPGRIGPTTAACLIAGKHTSGDARLSGSEISGGLLGKLNGAGGTMSEATSGAASSGFGAETPMSGTDNGKANGAGGTSTAVTPTTGPSTIGANAMPGACFGNSSDGSSMRPGCTLTTIGMLSASGGRTGIAGNCVIAAVPGALIAVGTGYARDASIHRPTGFNA